jgi:hypothetical protein
MSITNITVVPGKVNTVFDLFSLYKDELNSKNNSNEISLLQSALVRFTIPGWGGPLLKGERATPLEITTSLEFLKSIPAEKLPNALSIQKETFEKLGIKKDSQRAPRYRLKRFIEWVDLKGYLQNPESEEKTQEQIKNTPYRFKDYIPTYRDSNFKTQWKKPKPYALGAVEGDFINQYIQQDLEALEIFQKEVINCASQASRSNNRWQWMRMLGWMHREKGIPLEDLRLVADIDSGLPCIISFVKLKLSSCDFKDFNDYLLLEKKAEIRASEVAEMTIDACHKLFQWRSNLNEKQSAYPSDIKTLDALLVLAKYAYQTETNKTFAKDYEDIPVVKALQILKSQIYRKKAGQKKVLGRTTRGASWHEVITVREHLRKEANTRVYQNGKERPINVVANDMQNFLFLAFLTVIPPDRSRTFNELKIGETIKHGLFINNRFMPLSKILPEQAKFYIHLQPGDYKTSSKYGEWLGELPNEVYTPNEICADSNTFYEYLDLWLYRGYQDKEGNWHGLREAMILRNEKDKRIKSNANYTKPSSHNLFFVSTKGKKLHINRMYCSFMYLFSKFSPVSVNPHALRHIFRTHLKDIGASSQQLESAAYWMKHDLRTAESDYTHQEQISKLRPAAEMMGSLNKL